MDPDFTMDELLALLEQERGPERRGLSSAEIAEQLNRSRNWVYGRLQRLKQEGRLVVSYRRETRLDDNSCLIPVYSLKSKNPDEGDAES